MTETSKVAHTPGPWYEASTGNDQGLVVDENSGDNVAVVYDKANARLIAAAPKTLEALDKLADRADKVMADIYEGDTGWYYQLQCGIQEAQRASREATGDLRP